MRTVSVPIVVEVCEARVLARAAQDGCDFAVAAHRCAVSAMEASGLATEPTAQPAAAPKSKKGKR